MAATTTKQARIPYQHRVHLAAKNNDLAAAYVVYDEMMEHDILPNSDICSTILSLCARTSETIDRTRVERAVEVFDSTTESSVPPTESGFSCIIRLLCAIGDVETAIKYYERMIATRVTPHLRTFGPMFAALCDGTSTKAMLAQHMEKEVARFGLELQQEEYASLLLTYTRSGLTQHVKRILANIMTEIDTIEPQLETALAEHFDRIGYEHKHAIISTGVCPFTGIVLKRLDTSTESMCEQLVSFASAKPETAAPFETFRTWLTENSAKFDVVVDVANIGFFGQNHDGGVLTYKQIDAVVVALQTAGRKPLLVCSAKWLDPRVYTRPEKRAAADTVRRNRSGEIIGYKSNKVAAAAAPAAAVDSQGAGALIAKWQREALVYPVPRGSNDDWYWLYAAMSGSKQLVTNDLLRDHTYQMMSAGLCRSLAQWYESAVVSYSITGGTIVKFKLPAAFTRRPQLIDHTWFFPISGKRGTWLVCCRVSASTGPAPVKPIPP